MALFLFALSPGSAGAQTEVDLELVLLADATGSIDNAEIRFQRQGYADAIRDPAVLSAIAGTLTGRIAVTYVEWADFISQDVVVPWTIVDGPDTAASFAQALMAPPRRAYGRNAIGAALLFGRDLIEDNAIQGLRKVIDISADSANNWNGPTIEEGRDAALAAGITVNGLAVLCRHCSGRPISYDLEAAFQTRIIGGPGSFVITADSERTFADAVRRKLVLEIAGQVPLPEEAGRLAKNGR
ncbi:MAG: DUF1194 domain-containing protein [Pseudomonadota bacterium]